MLGEEGQIGVDAAADPFQRLLDAGDGGIDLLAELSHRPVGDGQEKFLLAGEIAVERPLADVEGLGQQLRVGFRVAVFGKQGGRRSELLSADRSGGIAAAVDIPCDSGVRHGCRTANASGLTGQSILTNGQRSCQMAGQQMGVSR